MLFKDMLFKVVDAIFIFCWWDCWNIKL